MLSLFEMTRQANVSQYIAAPISRLDGGELAGLARQLATTPDNLCQIAASPHSETICPLCGQPSTRLVICTGCDSDTWGYELTNAHGDDAQAQLQEQLRQALARSSGLDVADERIRQAAHSAYTPGGCMICSTCRTYTLPTQAYRSCPLYLLGERALGIEGALPDELMWAIMRAGRRDKAQARQILEDWMAGLWACWTAAWNTRPAGPEHDAVAAWRAAILYAALIARPGEAVHGWPTGDARACGPSCWPGEDGRIKRFTHSQAQNDS